MNVLFKHLLPAALTGLVALAGCANPVLDSVSRAKDVNETFAPKVSEPAADFLIAMVDSRLMDYQAGKLAVARGGTPLVREYGDWMMRDQPTLQKRLEALAVKTEVMVPSTIGTAKLEALKELQGLEGRDFDLAFMRRMRTDHERDVEAFRQATQLGAPAVREFALQTLPVIETHLAGIEQIQKDY